MTQWLIHHFRYGFMFALMTTATLSISAQDEMASDVIGPDGKPVEKATIYRVKEIGQTWGLEQIDLAEWRSGKRFEQTAIHKHSEYLVIESPGCALGIYQYRMDEFKLEKEFWVEGKVIDEDGKPVPDVELTLGKFGISSYTHILLNRMVGKLPWVQTKTDKNGKYRFRGSVLSNHRSGNGVEVTAQMMKNGKPMVGGSSLLFLSDRSLFDEARKNNRFNGVGEITIFPCDEISGVVVDSLTGKPMEGATIKARGMSYHTGSFQSGMITTDKDGKFSISNVRCEMLGVMHDNYSRGHLIPSADWRDKKQNKLIIKLAPLVNTTIQFMDTHSGKAPLVPLVFSYGVEAPAGDGWTLKIDEDDNCSAFFTQESQKIGVDGVYSGKLPVGKFQLNCHMDRKNEDGSPYAKSFELNIPSEGDRNFKVELERKPGLLFFLNPVSSSTLNNKNDKWDSLFSHLQVKGSPHIHYVTLHEKFHFQPASEWNQEMNFKVILRKDGNDTNLMDRNFIASPDAWPATIDVVNVLGNLIENHDP